jgi:deazaflavin-dependent oxidoreductase (nitroreductase family)
MTVVNTGHYRGTANLRGSTMRRERAMPLSMAVARLNRVGLNHVTRRIAPYVPGFGVVIHHGRKSGTRNQTPVNVFAKPGGYLFALTYGKDADWVRNVLAAGECDLLHQRQLVHLTAPTIVHDPQRRQVPTAVRTILGAIEVDDFLQMSTAAPVTGPDSGG